MPIYGYACQACGHVLDALQKMSDAPLVDCPECGAAALERQLSAPRFRLKGAGWYETDFKSDNQRNLAGDAEKSKTESTDGAAAGQSGDKADAKSGDKSGDKSPAKADKPAADKPAKATNSEAKAVKRESGDKTGTA